MVPKGFKMSENSKRKMSESHKGTIRTPEYRRALSEALKGRTFSDSHRKHLSEGRRGENNPFYNHKHSEEHNKTISTILTGRQFSKTARQKMSQAQSMRTGARNSFYGKHHTEETKNRLSQIHIALYANNPSLLKKCLTCQQPNKPEQKLISLMAEKGLPFKYVGDGQFILGGKCPDFINVNGKKQVVELFGTYWHDIFDMAERKEHFRQYGFETLIIWEDELKDMTKVIKKLVKFSKTSVGASSRS